MPVRKLVLYEDIVCGTTEDTGGGLLRLCRAAVTKRDMAPQRASYLSHCDPFTAGDTASVPAGTYLFIQGFLSPGIQAFDDCGTPAEALYDAAEELWLEFVWQETEPSDETVYVRILTHEGEYTDKATGEKKSAGLVFQLFRRNK
jgi:hypothetical protein